MSRINYFLTEEPTWLEATQWPASAIPQNALTWLMEPRSLTLRIKKTFKQAFSLKLIEQGWSTPMLSEAQCLGEPINEDMLIREVLLKLGQQTYVFARTSLPKKLVTNVCELTELGSKPLGEVIFAYPDLKRTKLEVAKVAVNQLKKSLIPDLSAEKFIWARRNHYQIEETTFLVSEFFLPAIYTS